MFTEYSLSLYNYEHFFIVGANARTGSVCFQDHIFKMLVGGQQRVIAANANFIIAQLFYNTYMYDECVILSINSK